MVFYEELVTASDEHVCRIREFVHRMQ